MAKKRAAETKVSLELWSKLSRMKADKLVPFVKFCRANQLICMSRNSWDELYKSFVTRPVR